MEPFSFVSKYFWLIAIIMTAVNWLIFGRSAQKHIEKDPSLKDGYEALFRGYIVWLNIPWVVMGVGTTVGGVPSVWHYFRPRDGNPYVLAWFASVFLLWVFGTFWLFFRGGAETLARHPGAVQFRYGSRMTSPALIKTTWLLALVGGILGFAMMWFMNVPLPDYR